MFKKLLQSQDALSQKNLSPFDSSSSVVIEKDVFLSNLIQDFTSNENQNFQKSPTKSPSLSPSPLKLKLDYNQHLQSPRLVSRGHSVGASNFSGSTKHYDQDLSTAGTVEWKFSSIDIEKIYSELQSNSPHDVEVLKNFTFIKNVKLDHPFSKFKNVLCFVKEISYPSDCFGHALGLLADLENPNETCEANFDAEIFEISGTNIRVGTVLYLNEISCFWLANSRKKVLNVIETNIVKTINLT